MAESVEYEIPNLGTKYFCHQCSREVSPYHSTELVCPECSTGFLEEVSRELYDSEIPETGGFESYFGEELPLMQEFISPNSLFSQMLHDDSEPEIEPEDRFFEDFPRFSDAVQLLTNDDVFRMRYLDDYNADADVDALATQLLDEVEISGPPPLSKEQIKILPIVSFGPEHKVDEQQCTVCMNDFKMGDKAKQLTCEHLFHEKCITPWLERQASCPNCRCTVKVDCKNKRSLSCPRTLNNVRSRSSNSNNRRLSEVSSLGDFFTASMNPFRFL